MSGKNTTVFGVYSDQAGFGAGLGQLRAAAFRDPEISFLMSRRAGALQWLDGAGALEIPDLGVFIAAGPIKALLVEAGGIAGGIAGSLIGVGIPEFEAKRYEGRVKSGNALLSVQCMDTERARRARAILQRTGADDVAAEGECSIDFAVNERLATRL